MRFRKITDIELKNKVVFIRVDMNVPMKDGVITDETRIKASLPSIKYALEAGAKVIVATHLGRPQEGLCTAQDSVKPIALILSKLLNANIPVIHHLTQKIDFTSTDIVMLQNVRCNIGEKKNSLELAKQYAELCDVYVHDAFATAHRAESSTAGVGLYADVVCAGILMAEELNALSKIVLNPQSPIIAIVGGSKVSTKLTILENLSEKVDVLIVGGGILNTFLSAKGINIAKSLYESELVKEAQHIMQKMHSRGTVLPLPNDVVVAKDFSPTAIATTKNINQLDADDIIMDIGADFAKQLAGLIKTAGTIIWNGPVGVFEFKKFSHGTQILANAIASSSGFSLAGGGDTIAAINKFNVFNKIGYISTAGGALLEFLEGKKLPAIDLLEQKGYIN
ncbi:MAG: phosphoglycerate kinase [Burkholderiales bacterium]|nr:phosphoglycerate kinase [Burkholderiales bacterium]